MCLCLCCASERYCFQTHGGCLWLAAVRLCNDVEARRDVPRLSMRGSMLWVSGVTSVSQKYKEQYDATVPLEFSNRNENINFVNIVAISHVVSALAVFYLFYFIFLSTDKYHAVPLFRFGNNTIFERNSEHTFISNVAWQHHKQDNANHI